MLELEISKQYKITHMSSKNNQKLTNKLTNKLIYQNFNEILKNDQNNSNPVVLELNKLFDNTDSKEVFHHAKSYADYGQNIRNKINASCLETKEGFRSEIDNEIIDNDNKKSFKVIRAFAALHDLKCALICTLAEVSLFFVIATLIHCKGQFNFSELWNDSMNEFQKRPWQSWLILTTLIVLVVLVTFVIPKLVNHYICKPYIQIREALVSAQKMFEANLYQEIEGYSTEDSSTEESKIDESLYEAILNGSGNIEDNIETKELRKKFLKAFEEINKSDIPYSKKVELIDTFLWKGYYKATDNSIDYNPFFTKYNLKIDLSLRIKIRFITVSNRNRLIQPTAQQ